MSKEMPAPVAEMVKTSEGRKYLAKLQERHKLDIVQPSDPLFDKVYGDKIRGQKAAEELQKKESEAMWREKEERREYSKRNWANRKYL